MISSSAGYVSKINKFCSPSGATRPANYDTSKLSVKEEPMPMDCSRGDEPKLEGDQSQILEALKKRIRELETDSKGMSEEKFLCLICMVSVDCRKFCINSFCSDPLITNNKFKMNLPNSAAP